MCLIKGNRNPPSAHLSARFPEPGPLIEEVRAWGRIYSKGSVHISRDTAWLVSCRRPEIQSTCQQFPVVPIKVFSTSNRSRHSQTIPGRSHATPAVLLLGDLPCRVANYVSLFIYVCTHEAPASCSRPCTHRSVKPGPHTHLDRRNLLPFDLGSSESSCSSHTRGRQDPPYNRRSPVGQKSYTRNPGVEPECRAKSGDQAPRV